MSVCAVCGVEVLEGAEVFGLVTGEGVETVTPQLLCRPCGDKELADTAEQDAVKSSADAPPGDDYGREQAAQVLGVSPRRVSQLVADGRLQVVQEKPLRVSAQSVHELREERRGRNRDQRATLPPESVAEQVERLVALVINEQRRALEVGEHLLAEITQQRDELKGEAERLRAQVEAERERAEDLRTQLAAVPVRRHWWKK